MLIRLTESDFDEVFAIMEASFPSDEHRPYGEQKKLQEIPAYRLYGYRDESGVLRGFMAVWCWEELWFLEHFAVDGACRGQGLGSRMVQELIGLSPRGLCLEAEPPETDLAVRRIGFYERSGFRLHPYPYTQPPISEGKNPVPLQIMTCKLPVTPEMFAQIRDLLYGRVYHCL